MEGVCRHVDGDGVTTSESHLHRCVPDVGDSRLRGWTSVPRPPVLKLRDTVVIPLHRPWSTPGGRRGPRPGWRRTSSVSTSSHPLRQSPIVTGSTEDEPLSGVYSGTLGPRGVAPGPDPKPRRGTETGSRRTVSVRPGESRGLKSSTSHRPVGGTPTRLLSLDGDFKDE